MVDILASMPWDGPAILLVDLDAFFASVEQLDHPAWRGKPVIVGGDSDRRGVVSTCSYEARKYGVQSAMPASQATRLCPDAIWTHGHYGRYREVSNQVMSILWDETPHVQQVSIDEAFMDVSPTAVNREHPVRIAQRIQERVAALGVTCSIGVGTSKAVAKIASDMDKPRGLTVVFPGSEREFLAPLPVRKMSGIGAAAEKQLHAHGIDTLGQLAEAGEETLERLLGKNGRVMYQRAIGMDDAPIEISAPIKSVSHETSFAEDITTTQDVHAAIDAMAAKVGRRLRKKGLQGRTLSLRIRFGDRTVRSVQRQLANPSDDELLFMPLLHSMLKELWYPGTPVRLVGVAITGFSENDSAQESLFDSSLFADEETVQAQPKIKNDAKRRGLLEATDLVRNRFGESAVQYGREIRSANNTTGTTAKNPEDYK